MKILIILRNYASNSNHSSKFTVLVVVAMTKETYKQTEQTHNLLISILVFVRVSYLFCASCMFYYGESKSTTSYVLYVKYEYDEYTSNIDYDKVA